MNRPVFAALLALVALILAAPKASAETSAAFAEKAYAQSSRPRIIIRPRRIKPGPNSRRYCRSRLVQEFRPSGTVIVPQTYCWWQ
jgi:hypothetical protein